MIEEVSPRREAFNIMLSMPQGTDPRIVRLAAREFAQVELKDHSYVMVLHEHQANPHVHLTVRAESFELLLDGLHLDLLVGRYSHIDRGPHGCSPV